MHHRIDVVPQHRGLEPGPVVNVALDHRVRAGDGPPVAGGKVVVDDDPLAAPAQGLDRVTPDVPRPPGDEDRAHGRPIEK